MMRYLGGKSRQSAAIARTVRDLRGARTRYVEPFTGGASVLSALCGMFDVVEASDVVADLVMFWEAIRRGWWSPPLSVSIDQYSALRDSESSPIRAWVGYAASYNGKWFSGYGPTASGRDYLAESFRSTMRKAETIRCHPNLTFHARDYADCPVDSNTVVYCDPPYAGTETYSATKPFDHDTFWRTMDIWCDRGALVLVHEYSAPPNWVPILSTDRVETMHHGGPSSGVRREHLYRRLP